jgi:hypothetical protein
MILVRVGGRAGTERSASMKNPVVKLILFVVVLILCFLAVFLGLRKFGPAGKNALSGDRAPMEEIEGIAENDPGEANAVAEAEEIVEMDIIVEAGIPASALAEITAAAVAEKAAAEKAATEKPVAEGTASNPTPAAVPATDPGSEAQPSDAKETASASNPADATEKGTASLAGAGQAKPSSRQDAPLSGGKRDAAADVGAAPAVFGGDDAYEYFEYQVITVPKKTLAEAAASMGLPKDSKPSDELLPAIYKAGGYRVIGFSAGYSAARTPVEFKMSRTEFFPDFYILPNDGSGSGDGGDSAADDGDDDNAADSGDANSDDNADGDDGEDGGDGEDDEEEDDGGYGPGDFDNSCNNLASILPFFGDPTTVGNEFFLDIRPPRIFSMESSLRKLSGFTNTDYGDWGEGQSPIFDDNSFSNALTATKGKPMIVAESSTSNAWTLHVFFTKALPMPERLVPAEGSENKLVRLDFQIVRAKWTDLMAAGGTDGCPGLPAETILEKLSKSNQLRDLYSPSFRVIPSQEPVTIQLNAKTQFVPLKWIPAQDYGVPAIPINSEAIWTGTTLKAAARVLNDGNIVRLDYRFEKVAQTGWRNYGYSFFGEPAAPVIVVQQDRYARPQSQQQTGPEIDTGLLKLPMIDTTAFRQALYLEVGKPVLAARISNPAYQPDMLTLLFVTATVEDAP